MAKVRPNLASPIEGNTSFICSFFQTIGSDRAVWENLNLNLLSMNCSSIGALAARVAVLIVLVAISIAAFVSSVHVVREGFVGIYFRNGALLDVITMPGTNVMKPLTL